VDLFRKPYGRDATELVVARRRKSWLEMLTGGLSVFCGIFFGAVFVAEHGQRPALGWALGAGVLTAAAVAMYRHKRPAEIREPQAVDLNSASDPTSDSAAEDDDEGCTFAVMGAVEYGVTMPLARRWGLPDFD
jgi:hypothetical protein